MHRLSRHPLFWNDYHSTPRGWVIAVGMVLMLPLWVLSWVYRAVTGRGLD